jgi:hypothetical protein
MLIWLLALAIPLQGAMASAMRCCGPEHHQSQNVGDRPLGTGLEQASDNHDGRSGQALDHHTSSLAHVERSGAVAQASGLHEHCPALANSHSDGAVARPGQHDAQKSSHPSTSLEAGKCSVCASCFTATGQPSQAPVIQAPSLDEVRVVSVGAPPPEFTTNGPDRPPRSFLV